MGNPILYSFIARENTADERMRVVKQLSQFMQPSTFIVEQKVLPFISVNPGIEIYKDILLVVWREGTWAKPIKMGWYHLKDALAGDFSSIQHIDIALPSSGYDQFGPEDPRLILLPTGRSV